jgi:hypothetical protein
MVQGELTFPSQPPKLGSGYIVVKQPELGYRPPRLVCDGSAAAGISDLCVSGRGKAGVGPLQN